VEDTEGMHSHRNNASLSRWALCNDGEVTLVVLVPVLIFESAGRVEPEDN